MKHITRGRLLAAGTAFTLAAGGAAATAVTSQGEAGDPRAKLFSQPMDLIVDASEMPRILADMERNPAKYDGLDIGVDTSKEQRTGAMQAAVDATLARTQEAGR